MRLHHAIPAALLLAACAYEAEIETDDPFIAPPRLSGTVLVQGLDVAADTMVLIYDAADPPPPAGTGSPLTFGVVPASAFATTGSGLLEAPFDLSLAGIPDGQVLVTALVDVDGDFYPLPPYSSVTGGATCGDRLGAHVSDLETGALAPVTVSQNTLTDGITVIVAREVPTERPAFVFQGGSPTIAKEAVLAGGTETFRLASTAIAVGRTVEAEDGGTFVESMLELDGPFDGSDPCHTAFWVTVYDRDGDGQPDAHPDLGPAAIDAWPRVILQYAGTLAEDGATLIPADPAEGAYVAQAAYLPSPVWFGDIALNTPTPRTEIELVWVPGARRILPDGTVEVLSPDLTAEDAAEQLDAIPSGVWSVTLIAETGQTWTLPNRLWQLPPLGEDDGYEPDSQRGALILE